MPLLRRDLSAREYLKMFYRLAADSVLIFHFLFIVFVMLGGLFVLRHSWAVAVHIPAACWGTFTEISGRLCPLTTLEVYFRQAAGELAYSESFIEHYLYPVIYPAGLTRETQFLLAGIVIMANAVIYGWVLYRYLIRQKQGWK